LLEGHEFILLEGMDGLFRAAPNAIPEESNDDAEAFVR
jgi:hypothetical protein